MYTLVLPTISSLYRHPAKATTTDISLYTPWILPEIDLYKNNNKH